MNFENYKILYAARVPEMRGWWDGEIWEAVLPLAIECFRPEGSGHRPRTRCKLLYNEQTIFGIFRVEDQFVRCIHRDFQSDVWQDSCVEFFVQPQAGSGYFNFEFNCGGALLASYVTKAARVEGRLQEVRPLTADDDRQIRRWASLPQKVLPEIQTPITWCLEFAIPIAVLEKYTGPLGPVRGQIWRANFYKCGNETSHPHWLSWAPLRERNFHDPASFGSIEFC